MTLQIEAPHEMPVWAPLLSPGRALITLYDRAIEDTGHGSRTIRAGSPDRSRRALHGVCAIVRELAAALDFDVAPQLCDQLHQLYVYIEQRLVHAALNQDADSCDEVVQLLELLRRAWVQAVARVEIRARPSATPSCSAS